MIKGNESDVRAGSNDRLVRVGLICGFEHLRVPFKAGWIKMRPTLFPSQVANGVTRILYVESHEDAAAFRFVLW